LQGCGEFGPALAQFFVISLKPFGPAAQASDCLTNRSRPATREIETGELGPDGKTVPDFLRRFAGHHA
jgi:hypothetical protein